MNPLPSASATLLAGFALALAGCSVDAAESAPEVEAAAPDSAASIEREIALLEAIGYSGGEEEAPASSGVLVHDARRASPGLNLVLSGHAPEAFLVDMRGDVLHSWRKGFHETWPDRTLPKRDANIRFWRRVHLFENGDLLAIHEGLGIVKLDAESNLIWASDVPAHHDLFVAANGDVIVLTRKAHVLPQHSPRPILEDFICVLSAEGREKRSFSLIDAFLSSPHAGMWERRPHRHGDVMHTNSLEILGGRIADEVPAFAAGRALISLRTWDALAVVDMEREEVVWAHSGEYKAQHDPRILENGNLLLFDNRGVEGHSRVIEYDVATMTPVWTYADSPEHPLRSGTCGAAQRLPNGNTLITESARGRAIETTPEGETVWEYVNPYRFRGKKRDRIPRLFEVVRLSPIVPSWAGSGGS